MTQAVVARSRAHTHVMVSGAHTVSRPCVLIALSPCVIHQGWTCPRWYDTKEQLKFPSSQMQHYLTHTGSSYSTAACQRHSPLRITPFWLDLTLKYYQGETLGIERQGDGEGERYRERSEKFEREWKWQKVPVSNQISNTEHVISGKGECNDNHSPLAVCIQRIEWDISSIGP